MILRDKGLIGQLNRSEIYRDYERAFSAATELPLSLRPPQTLALVHHGHANENPFCALLAESNKGCVACLEMQGKLGESQSTGATSATCFAGLCDTSVPVKIGQNLIGHLQTGQVALRPPTPLKFKQISKKVIEWGASVDLRKLEDAYFHSKVLTPKQYGGMVRLLETFAIHLELIGNQIAIQDAEAESPFSIRAKAYVAEHQDGPISLQEIAASLHVSTFYFCKMFKKTTGLTFTDYIGRVRIERAKVLLLNPNQRISEIAYEIGFSSLTHFNRLFKDIVGQSPSDFRKNLP